jgi:hypothetical protein
MCRHSSIMTRETCAICAEEPDEQKDGTPIYEGMSAIDLEAERLGDRMRAYTRGSAPIGARINHPSGGLGINACRAPMTTRGSGRGRGRG